MLSNPIVRFELIRAARRPRHYAMRAAAGLVLLYAAWMLYRVFDDPWQATAGGWEWSRLLHNLPWIADLLVLEGVPAPLAKAITEASPIPTIGIGAGAGCDGQVLVLHDLLGLDTGHRKPKFVKDFLAEGGSVAGAIRAFAEAVRSGGFPDAAHSYA